MVERFGDTAIDLWHENHRIMTEEMSRRGIEVLEPPEIVCKEGGGPRLLRDVLCDNEVANSAHGNPWYGEIFLRDIFTGVGVDGVAGDARLRSELNSPDAELEREVQLGFALANRRGDAAPIFLKAMQRHPRDRRLLYGLGYALERKNRLLDAEACYLDLAEVAPDWDEAWFAIARVRWQRVPDTRCLEAIEKARSLGCERPSARLLHGAILEKLSRRQAARAVLREVLFEPGTGKLKPEWAGLLEPSDPQETGFFELKADPERDSYLRALEQVPSIAPYLAVLARLELELGNKGAGGHAIRLALKISPERQEWHSILADIIMAQEDWKLAAHHYRIASAAAPKIARYALALGSALEKSGDPKDARAVYLTAARDHPNDSRFTAALHRITSGVAPHPPKPKEAQKQPPPQRTESENLEWRQRLSSTWIVKQAGRARRFLKRRLGLSP